MNKLKDAALRRWKKKFEDDLSKIPEDKDSLIMKAALCGFLAGDGSVQVRKEKISKNSIHHQLDFFPDDEEMLKTYLEFIKKIYHRTPRVTIRYNVYVARLSQKYVIVDLKKLCDFGLYKWGFPNELFKIKEAKRAWIRAFFSAEGYVGGRAIKIQGVNTSSMKKIKNLLAEFGIKSTYHEYQPKKENYSKVGMIFISEKRSRIIYSEKIGFWHRRKSEKLKQTLNL